MNEHHIIYLLNGSVLLLLCVTAYAALYSRNLVISTIYLAAFSLLMAFQYLILDAPDVAITEAAVGAGISTILFLLVLSITGEQEALSTQSVMIPGLVVLITGLALIYAALDMPGFGELANETNQHVVPYYLKESFKDIGIPNVVTSILASYRAFDTLGEVTVVFTAALCVMLLLGKRSKSV